MLWMVCVCPVAGEHENRAPADDDSEKTSGSQLKVTQGEMAEGRYNCKREPEESAAVLGDALLV
jgi:hypothetical protein